MKASDLLKVRPPIFGVGVVVFATLALVTLLNMLEAGEHPLTLETDFDLCDRLGDDVWYQLQYPAADAVARAPGDATGATTCVYELDPVPGNDRWARVARGGDADQVRRIASAMLTTTAALRRDNPAAEAPEYARIFDEELVASGWDKREIEGPWTWGSVYTLEADGVAALVEDDGVVLWVTARDVEPDNMVVFAQNASRRIRDGQ